MPIYRHVVRLPFSSALPEDVAVNVFHCIADDDGAANSFTQDLITFYGAIDGLLSNQLSGAAGAASITTYDLSDPEPRAPVDVDTFTLTLNASTLPLEVAVCMSFQAVKTSGLSQARRRGRIFLGPLGGIQDSTTGRPQSAHLTTFTNAADTLLTASKAAATFGWAVYSPTNANAVEVDNGWFDNEFDTIRERGRVATTRNLFS